ncbi:STAS domain-containing protein [Streptomyces sp. SID8379]|uniref:STAS domain-containing protein n=1 Tax=unclassified Streptomyces TaxID=2593676 RepID=UPI00037CBA4F|nr:MULTISPECIES: STAS domain-containing protein [unclassified Streptomyces]MYW70093.1 STAS domain-containing protein [Streptomyces sp. SID8379]
MTAYVPLSLVTAGPSEGVLTVEIRGALDYETSDQFCGYARKALADHPGIRTLRLDCAGVTLVDSMGLSVLLRLRREVHGAGSRLRLERRPLRLERLLQLTGTLEHLTGAPAAEQSDEAATGDADTAGHEDQSPGHGR